MIARSAEACTVVVTVLDVSLALLLSAVPLVANVTATETTDPTEIKELLVEQVTRMVRWRETVLLFAANQVEEVVELGAGRVLAGLIKRIDRELLAVFGANALARAREVFRGSGLSTASRQGPVS